MNTTPKPLVLGLFLPRQIVNRDVQTYHNFGHFFLKNIENSEKKEQHSKAMTIDDATCTPLNGFCHLHTICFDFLD